MALLLFMMANAISGNTQCSNRFHDDDCDHIDRVDDYRDQDFKGKTSGATLVETDGAVRGGRTV